MSSLIYFLDTYNELVQLFRTTRDKYRELDIPEFKIRLYNGEGARGYEFPTSNTLGAMVFESGITSNTYFDVIIQHKDGPPQRVNKLHPSYMSLQFPLLFIYRKSRYHTDLMIKSADGHGRARRIIMLAYCIYELHFRLQQYDLLFRDGSLFQQYIVGEHDGYEVGGRIILSISFTSGPRYMYAHYLDALAICRKMGNLHFFITFTCNVNWLEIKRFMAQYPELTASDSADVVNVIGVLYIVEFQKRGLPHCHTLLWVDSESKIKSAEDVDKYISAELPDPRIDPDGYNIVSETMMHGPCGAANMKASCIKGDKCGKSFPKKFNSKTFFDDNAFRAHINVEYCGWSMLIKYLFKYISKGTDRIFAQVSRPMAYWRILKFDIHHREPAVQILAVHLEDIQRITFRDKDRLRSLVDLPGKKNTTLTEWFAYNASNEMGRHLSYLEFPSEFVWHSDSKSWLPRRNNKDFFEVQTIKDVFYLTYKAACEALGLLGDDREWETTLEDACASTTFEQLRK
ncbi:DNA helicase [Tanacetum coccineum]|uniref:DNA helicase n=1 Tax=Tanacetum coccineum TaxID=301880 RepID=A0ABQ5IZ37_9ASTR